MGVELTEVIRISMDKSAQLKNTLTAQYHSIYKCILNDICECGWFESEFSTTQKLDALCEALYFVDPDQVQGFFKTINSAYRERACYSGIPDNDEKTPKPVKNPPIKPNDTDTDTQVAVSDIENDDEMIIAVTPVKPSTHEEDSAIESAPSTDIINPFLVLDKQIEKSKKNLNFSNPSDDNNNTTKRKKSRESLGVKIGTSPTSLKRLRDLQTPPQQKRQKKTQETAEKSKPQESPDNFSHQSFTDALGLLADKHVPNNKLLPALKQLNDHTNP